MPDRDSEPSHRSLIRPAAGKERVLWAIKKAACQATHEHEIGVGLEVEALSRFLGWDRATASDFGYCAQFHDVGKIFTPRSILWKSDRLTSDEMTVMKRHAADGADILSRLSGTLGETGAQMANLHHERPDGHGYYGFKGSGIPSFARICAVGDVYEALTSRHRLYKLAIDPGETLLLMVNKTPAGRLGQDQFDPAILHAFVRMKLFTEKANIRPDHAAALEEYLHRERIGRKAEIAAFTIALEGLARHFGRNHQRDKIIAARIYQATLSDQEKADILLRHRLDKAVAALSAPKEQSRRRTAVSVELAR